MKLKALMRLVIGSLVFFSSLLAYIYSETWLFFTMFIGLNMMQYPVTGFCGLEVFLKKLGFKE